MLLSRYVKDLRKQLGDQPNSTYQETDLIDYINQGRFQVAQETGCIRELLTLYTITGVEKYRFIDVPYPPGTCGILHLQAVTILWNSFQYNCRWVGFEKYQALIRNYTTGYQDVPSFAALQGRGTFSTLYLYPISSQVYEMTWDCFLLPSELTDDSVPDVIPQPFCEAVTFYAAFKALNSFQGDTNAEQAIARTRMADRNFNLYDKFVKRATAFSNRGHVSNWYGRG